MKEKELLERISELIAEGEQVNPDTILADLSGWDSIGKLTMVALISDIVKGPFQVGQMKEFKQVNDILEFVRDRLEK